MTFTRSSEGTLQQLRKEVRAWLADEIDSGRLVPQVDSWAAGFSRAFSLRLAQQGWVGMTIPVEYGGAGRSHLERFVVAEELLAVGAPVTSHWAAERQIAPMLLRVGTDEQRRRLLPGIAAGTLAFGIGLSEPDSGSDLASLRSRATRVDGGWALSGQKVWTSAGHLVEYTVVLCRTSDEADHHSGMSQLLVDMNSQGVDVRPITTMNGAAEFCEIFFDNVFVPDADAVGEVGAGWRQATQELGWERSGPDRYLSTYPLLAAYASQGGPADDAAVGGLAARMASCRALSLQVAAKGQAGVDFGPDAALAKDAGTVFEQDSVEVVRQAVGLDCPDDNLRALLTATQLVAPTFTLRGGTNEILRGITARQLMRR